MKLEDARRIAEHIAIDMRAFCERVDVAGSIRRGKLDVMGGT